MFITTVCLIFLLKFKWPKNKSVYDFVNWIEINNAESTLFNRFCVWPSDLDTLSARNCKVKHVKKNDEKGISQIIVCWARFYQILAQILEACGESTPGGTLSKIWWGCAVRFPNPYSFYEQNLWFSQPYLWPDQKFETLFMTWTLNQKPVSDLRYN